MKHDQTIDRPRPTMPGEADAYASLSKLVYADRPVADTLERIAVLATESVTETLEVSLTVIEGERTSTVASSGPTALDLDKRQYDLGNGPCLDAALYGETVKLTIDGADQPYPVLRQAARRHGVTHTMSVGLATGDQVLGAMNIYNFSGRPLNGDGDRIARTFAACAGIVLANVERYRRAAERASHLEMAMQSRAPIEQAKGILMGLHGCSGEEAFGMLIGLSQARNVKLRVIAQELVQERTSS